MLHNPWSGLSKNPDYWELTDIVHKTCITLGLIDLLMENYNIYKHLYVYSSDIWPPYVKSRDLRIKPRDFSVKSRN